MNAFISVQSGNAEKDTSFTMLTGKLKWSISFQKARQFSVANVFHQRNMHKVVYGILELRALWIFKNVFKSKPFRISKQSSLRYIDK